MARTLLVALLLAATYGCSNDGGSTDNTLPGTDATATSTSTSLSGSSSTAATGIPASTTVATPTTKPVITSADPTTSQDTAPIETTPSSTDPPLDVTPPERDQLLAAMQRWNSTFLACTRFPADCDSTVITGVSAEAQALRLEEQVARRLADGVQGLADAVHPTYYVVLDAAVSDGGTRGYVTVCDVNGDADVRLNEIGNAEDDEIVNDTLVSARITYDFVRSGETFKVVASDVTDVVREVNACPPAA